MVVHLMGGCNGHVGCITTTVVDDDDGNGGSIDQAMGWW